MPRIINKLSNCDYCPRNCNIDRTTGNKGVCGIGENVKISFAGLHFGEEPPISGSDGSGTIFFAGCNLKCVFCQNYQISQQFKFIKTRDLTCEQLADEILQLQEQGAHNINFVSPSHVIFQMAEAISIAKDKGLFIPVVYNSNGYDSVESLKQIERLVDIYLPDLKYMDAFISKKYSGAEDYPLIVTNAIKEMWNQKGDLEFNRNGIAKRGLLIRHLVLPGHVENSKRCLDFLAEISKDIFISIMSQYSPQYKACEYPLINRTLRKSEYDEVTEYALSLGLENLFLQELESNEKFLPDFDTDSPFERI